MTYYNNGSCKKLLINYNYEFLTNYSKGQFIKIIFSFIFELSNKGPEQD